MAEEKADLQAPIAKEQVYRFDQVGSKMGGEGEVKGVATTIKRVKPTLEKIIMPTWEKVGMEGLGIVALLTLLIWLFFHLRYRHKKDEIVAEPGKHPAHLNFSEIRFQLWLLKHLPLRLQPNSVRKHPHQPFTLKDNLLILIFHPFFKALRYAVILWLVFTMSTGSMSWYFLTRGAIKIFADSPVTDTFTDETKIASSTNITVDTVAGQVKLASSWSCGQPITDPRDGNTYNTVLIGSQCWMAENLNYGTMTAGANNQGSDCPSVAETEKYCYGDTESNCTSDGALYQWAQAMCGAASCNGTGAPPNDACASPVQGICPDGWHIPSHYEYTTLEREVCDSGTCATDFPYNESTTGWRGTDEGTQLKVGGSSGWEGLLAGYRNAGGSFLDRGAGARIWSSLESGSNAWRRYLGSGDAAVFRDASNKLNGFSVRCLKD